MKNIGILYHPHKPASQEVAGQVQSWLSHQAYTVWVDANQETLRPDVSLAGSDLLVVLGGDGATLRAARLTAPYQLPLFCINMGRIGFLSEAELDNWQQKLALVLSGDYWLERRLMLKAEARRQNETLQELIALNDIVVGRGTHARVVRLSLYVDGDWVTTYTADSLIVATPTGSTAYSMAAGGPLLPPDLQNFLVVPVAPHLSFGRALVLHQQAVISIEVEMQHEATITADGQEFVELQSGDKVLLQRHSAEALFARVGDSGYFYQRLMRRLGVHQRLSEM